MQQNEYISKAISTFVLVHKHIKSRCGSCPAQIIQRVLEYGTLSDYLGPRALAYICCISKTSKEEYRCYHTRLRKPTIWNAE